MVFRRKKSPIAAEPQKVLEYATWLLARRNYSRVELLEKFRGRFLPAEEIFIATLDRLEQLGLQSDELFAETFVRSKEGWGARRLSLELKKRGIDEDLIARFLPNENFEIERAQLALARKLRGEEIPTDFKEKQKLTAFLARRGFSLDVIREVLR